MKHHWIAVCFGIAYEQGRVVASCMTLWATNRFDALNQIKERLPENENWVAPNGKLRPFRVLSLEQCAPSEAEERAMIYMQSLYELMQEGPGPSAHSA